MKVSERVKIIKLMLWMTDRPLKVSDFKNVLDKDCPEEEKLLKEIRSIGKVLDENEEPLQLMEVAKGFQIASRSEYSPWVRRLYKEKTVLRLSQSALETLSIVAYKQPITRGEIEEIRGVEVSGVLDTLLDRKLLKIVGRKEALGRPLLYGTTLEFMRQFGLKSLEELPKLEDLMPAESDELPLNPAPDAQEAPVTDGETFPEESPESSQEASPDPAEASPEPEPQA